MVSKTKAYLDERSGLAYTREQIARHAVSSHNLCMQILFWGTQHKRSKEYMIQQLVDEQRIDKA